MCYSNFSPFYVEKNTKYSNCLLCKMREHVFTEQRPNSLGRIPFIIHGISLSLSEPRTVYVTLTLLMYYAFYYMTQFVVKQVWKEGFQHLRWMSWSTFEGKFIFHFSLKRLLQYITLVLSKTITLPHPACTGHFVSLACDRSVWRYEFGLMNMLDPFYSALPRTLCPERSPCVESQDCFLTVILIHLQHSLEMDSSPSS